MINKLDTMRITEDKKLMKELEPGCTKSFMSRISGVVGQANENQPC